MIKLRFVKGKDQKKSPEINKDFGDIYFKEIQIVLQINTNIV